MVNLFVNLVKIFLVRHRQGVVSRDDQRLKLFTAEYSPQAETAKMAICFGGDAGIGDEIFTCAADSHNGPDARSGFVIPDDPPHGETAHHAPEGSGIAKVDNIAMDSQIERCSACSLDDYHPISS